MAAASLLLVSLLGNPVAARPTGPTWESHTEGSAVSTLQGWWTESDDSREVTLNFAGGHAVGSKTSFKATWLSPFTTADAEPEYELALELNNMNELGENIGLVSLFRYRLKGEPWSSWFRDRFTLEPGWNFLGMGSSFMCLGDCGRVKFEWRLEGTIMAPTEIDGHAQLRVN